MGDRSVQPTRTMTFPNLRAESSSTVRSPLFRAIRIIACVLGALASTSLAHAQSGPRQTVASIESAEARIYAIPGRTLVFHIRPTGAGADALRRADPEAGNGTAVFPSASAPWVPAGSHTVRLSNGNRLNSAIFWLSALYPLQRPDDWLPPAGSWTATPLAEMTAIAAADPEGSWFRQGFWVMSIDLPESVAGRSLALDGKSLPIVWLEPPPAKTDDTRSPRPDAPFEIKRALGERLRADYQDPLLRWRVRLLTDRMRPTALWGNAPPSEQMHHPVLDALSRVIEDRWRIAIQRINEIDPQVGADVVHAISAVVLMPDGSLLPAWTRDATGMARFIDGVLDPQATPARRLSTAEAWLTSLPAAVAWVLDDSTPGTTYITSLGASEPTANVTIAITELRGHRTICSAAAARQAARNPTQLEGHDSATLRVETRIDERDPIAEIIARCGAWRRSLGALVGGLPSEPPGVRMGPFVAPWTHSTWLAGRPTSLGGRHAGAAMLQPSSSGGADGGRAGWELYIECRNPEAPVLGGRTEREMVRVWLGPYGAPLAVLRIEPDGSVYDETFGSPTAGRALSIRNEGASWSAIIPIPDRAIESGRRLRLALERIDRTGIRTSWPRPMLPREEEPGRVLIDLGAWSRIDESPIDRP